MEFDHMDTRSLQDRAHDDVWDYRVGSPHLAHRRLFDWLLGVLRLALSDLHADGLPLRVLDIGAGHGGFTEPLLAAGCQVVATEMSTSSIARLQNTYALNPNFRSVLDKDGTLAALDNETFSLILCSSVLHHIPEYLTFLKGPMLDHMRPGGTFISFQDPLWYPTLPAMVHRADRIAFLLWRLSRGNYRRGAASLWRRTTRTMNETNPSDMVEYHVLRNGVNHEAIRAALAERFGSVAIATYWSTQSALLQAVGDRVGFPNTFMMTARSYA
jgi:SAM-dependent methyltransferase